MYKYPVCIIFPAMLGLIAACNDPRSERPADKLWNPPAAGFQLEQSDTRAIRLADSVMWALGGRQAWDRTCCFSWNFFGRRRLWWDKHRQQARIEWFSDSLIVVVHLADTTGQAWWKGRAVRDPDSLRLFLSKGISAWINDSYWLFMPYKLKDSGVTLKYVGRDSTMNGTLAEVVQLTFSGVGETPHNKYHVYIDPDSYLVVQWDFYLDAADTIPRFRTPWNGWKRYGQIKLSGDRGQRQITDIEVHPSFPPELFGQLTY